MTRQSEAQSSHGSVPAAPAVRTADLSLSYDTRCVLRRINLEIAPAQTVAVMGANAAGKSTLLKILATLLRPSEGTVKVFGQDVTTPAAAGVRERIGVISHQPILYRELTARENVEFFAALYNVGDPRARAAEALETVGMTARAGDRVKALSRGMTQRVSIARAIVHAPDLLLADEPFDGLDATSARMLEQLLAGLQAKGKTLVMANHDIRQSLEIAARAVVLRGGQIVLDCPASQTNVAEVLGAMSGS